MLFTSIVIQNEKIIGNSVQLPDLSVVEGKFGVEHLFAPAIFQESGAFLAAKEVGGEGHSGGGGGTANVEQNRITSRLSNGAGAEQSVSRVVSSLTSGVLARNIPSARQSRADQPAYRAYRSKVFSLIPSPSQLSRVPISNSSQKLFAIIDTTILDLIHVSNLYDRNREFSIRQ